MWEAIRFDSRWETSPSKNATNRARILSHFTLMPPRTEEGFLGLEGYLVALS